MSSKFDEMIHCIQYEGNDILLASSVARRKKIYIYKGNLEHLKPYTNQPPRVLAEICKQNTETAVGGMARIIKSRVNFSIEIFLHAEAPKR